MDELEAAIPAVESDWASVKAAQAGEFDTAQQTRSEMFSQRISGWDAQAGQAAKSAVDAAAAAIAVAATVQQKLDSGQLNGPGFQLKYERASFAEIQAITDANEGDTAIILGPDKHVESYGQTYVYGHDGNWYESVAGNSVVGPPGPQGVGVQSMYMDGSVVKATMHNPETQQTDTQTVGDLTQPIAGQVQSVVDSRIQVVTEYPAAPVDGVVYMEVM